MFEQTILIIFHPLCVYLRTARGDSCAGRFGKPPRKLHSSSVVSHKVLSDHHRSFQFFSWQLNPKKFLFGTSIFLKYNTYIQSKETGLYIHLVGLKIVGLKVCLNVKIDVKTTQVRLKFFLMISIILKLFVVQKIFFVPMLFQ